MKEVRFFYAPEATTSNELPVDEAMHALRVLRLQSGDEMMLMDGCGNYYRAEVTLAHTKRCLYEIKETFPQQRQWNGNIHLAIAPTKLMDRMEWMLEKAVEIGIDEISFMNCQFSERRVVKLLRLEKIVVAAMKQSHKAWKTQVNDIVSFKEFISQPREGRKYIAHCYEEVPRTYLFDELRNSAPADDATVLIGPEGDFSIDEVRLAVANGYQSVHLGESRLRTETAGISAVMREPRRRSRRDPDGGQFLPLGHCAGTGSRSLGGAYPLSCGMGTGEERGVSPRPSSQNHTLRRVAGNRRLRAT